MSEFEIPKSLQKGGSSFINTLKYARTMMTVGRVMLTTLILGWLIFLTYYLMRPVQTEIEEERKQAYYNVHRAWFGDQSIVFSLFQIWYYTLLFALIAPIFGELFFALRVQYLS